MVVEGVSREHRMHDSKRLSFFVFLSLSISWLKTKGVMLVSGRKDKDPQSLFYPSKFKRYSH